MTKVTSRTIRRVPGLYLLLEGGYVQSRAQGDLVHRLIVNHISQSFTVPQPQVPLSA